MVRVKSVPVDDSLLNSVVMIGGRRDDTTPDILKFQKMDNF